MACYSATLSYKASDLLDLLDTIITGATVSAATRHCLRVKIIRLDTTTSELDLEVIASDVTLIASFKNYIDSCETESLLNTI